MKTIYKYLLRVADSQELLLPIGAQILTVQTQGEGVCLWALIDPTAEKEVRIIEIYGTGHEINYGMGTNRVYINTFKMFNDTIIFHAFEYTGV